MIQPHIIGDVKKELCYTPEVVVVVVMF